jgi:hypothetical protein
MRGRRFLPVILLSRFLSLGSCRWPEKLSAEFVFERLCIMNLMQKSSTKLATTKQKMAYNWKFYQLSS